MGINYPTLAHFRHFRHFRHSVPLQNESLRIHSYEIISFLCKTKPKSSRPKINLSSFVTSKYVLIGHLVIQTTKPIQSQFKPIQSQFVERVKSDANLSYKRAYEENATTGQKANPIKSQNKPNLKRC